MVERTNHSLSMDYYKVFVNECNHVASPTNDDVIFEIPFGKESTGSIGYIHGPKMDNASGVTPMPGVRPQARPSSTPSTVSSSRRVTCVAIT